MKEARVLATEASVRCGPEPLWRPCNLPRGSYRLRALTRGEPGTTENAALVCFETERPLEQPPMGLTLSASVGPYVYLQTGSGLRATDHLLSVPERVRRYALMSWGDRGATRIEAMNLERLPDADAVRACPTDFFLSFDVEALPGRAPSDSLVSHLLWGKVGGGEFGIRRLCSILDEHDIRGNFMVDFSSCLTDERGVRQAVEFLAASGHEVQLHLHPEWVLRGWGLASSDGPPVHFDELDYDVASRVLEFACQRYLQYLGKPATIFRSGGFRFNLDTVLAARALGITALSNTRFRFTSEPSTPGTMAHNDGPFVWHGGLVELPVDFSPEPLSSAFEKLEGAHLRALRSRRHKTFNLVMHSWSLLRRSANGHHEAFAPEHETRLHQLCEYVRSSGRSWTYSEYVSARGDELPRLALRHVAPRLERAPSAVQPRAECTLCGALMSRDALRGDTCLGCGARARHRQLKDVFDKYGNVFDGRSVIACHATPSEKAAFLARVTRLFNFDIRPVGYADAQLDIQNLEGVQDASFEGFFALHVLNHVKDDERALSEVRRVLKPGGVFVTTVPHREGEPTTPAPDLTEHYGEESLTRYGVGTYRRYGLYDFLALLTRSFAVSTISGYDSLSMEASRVFIARVES
ncbi:MAG: methyltransferase domain-containing protein [Polyangiaceae bacterium]|nr:methyltransferase domain-containing protein [Polyangiaceae bacterium]